MLHFTKHIISNAFAWWSSLPKDVPSLFSFTLIIAINKTQPMSSFLINLLIHSCPTCYIYGSKTNLPYVNKFQNWKRKKTSNNVKCPKSQRRIFRLSHHVCMLYFLYRVYMWMSYRAILSGSAVVGACAVCSCEGPRRHWLRSGLDAPHRAVARRKPGRAYVRTASV